MAAAEKVRGDQKFRSLFDLPPDFFDSCRLLRLHSTITAAGQPGPNASNASVEGTAVREESLPQISEEEVKGVAQRWTCNTCKSEFESLQDQRSHFQSDLHRLNIKLSVSGKNVVKEEEFDEQGCDASFQDFDVSSISGSEDETEKDTVASLKAMEGIKSKLYFRLHSRETISLQRSLLLDESEDISFDAYKVNQQRNGGSALIMEVELINRLKYLLHEPRDKTHLRIVLLLSGGHFAGCVFDGNLIIAHKTFHRYVVRAKAGKKQSTKDGTGKSAHSAGSSLRRHNEVALKKEIHDLLVTWQPYINSSLCIFVYAPSRNRQILFDGEKQQFGFPDRVTRHIPLTVHRPTLKEAKRIYHSLTQLSFEVDDNDSTLKESDLSSANEGKEKQICHGSHICEQLEVTTSSSPPGSAVEHLPSNLANISLSQCENRSTPLHVAAQSGNAEWTLKLLEQGCDPCLKDERGRTPYMLATEKTVRNTIRRFMAANLDRWDWQAAHVPSPLTKEMEESQGAKQAEKDSKRKAKAKELKKLRKEKERAKAQETMSQDVSTVVPQHQIAVPLAPSKQLPQYNARGNMAQEGTQRVAPSKQQPKSNGGMAVSKEEEERLAITAEREKRAAAAERRIAAMKNEVTAAVTTPSSSLDTKGVAGDLLCSCCNASLAGKIPFHRYHYKYCSTSCMHIHREILEDR